MKYSIIIQRTHETEPIKKPNSDKPAESATIGTYTVRDEYGNVFLSGYTLENRGPSDDIRGNDTRVVARPYNLSWHKSSKNGRLKEPFKNQALLLSCPDSIPDFHTRYILIHTGNYPQDTEGCILLGNGINSTKDMVTSSTDAVNALFTFVKEHGDVENFILKVQELA